MTLLTASQYSTIGELTGSDRAVKLSGVLLKGVLEGVRRAHITVLPRAGMDSFTPSALIFNIVNLSITATTFVMMIPRAHQTALLLVSSLVLWSQVNSHISRGDDPCSVAAAAFTETQGSFPDFLDF